MGPFTWLFPWWSSSLEFDVLKKTASRFSFGLYSAPICRLTVRLTQHVFVSPILPLEPTETHEQEIHPCVFYFLFFLYNIFLSWFLENVSFGLWMEIMRNSMFFQFTFSCFKYIVGFSSISLSKSFINSNLDSDFPCLLWIIQNYFLIHH